MRLLGHLGRGAGVGDGLTARLDELRLQAARPAPVHHAVLHVADVVDVSVRVDRQVVDAVVLPAAGVEDVRAVAVGGRQLGVVDAPRLTAEAVDAKVAGEHARAEGAPRLRPAVVVPAGHREALAVGHRREARHHRRVARPHGQPGVLVVLDDARVTRALIAAEDVRLSGGGRDGVGVVLRDEGRAARAVAGADALRRRDLVLGRHRPVGRLAAGVRRAGVEAHAARLAGVIEGGVDVRPVSVDGEFDVARLVEDAPARGRLEGAHPVHRAVGGRQAPSDGARVVLAVRVRLQNLALFLATVGRRRREVDRVVGGVVLEPQGGADLVELRLPHKRAVGRGELGDEARAHLGGVVARRLARVARAVDVAAASTSTPTT